MKQLSTLIQQAKLEEALGYISNLLQEQPQDSNIRSHFIELLCIDGQLERADKQLNMLIKQHPDCLVGASNLRLLIRAAQARRDFYNGAATASLVREVDESFTALVSIKLAANDDNTQLLEESAKQLEETRKECQLVIDGIEQESLRDIDDTLAGYLEVFGTNGLYYLVPFDALIHLELKPVTSLVEQVWRKVEIDIEGGLSGEAFIPITYIESQTDAQKLGRETDWFTVNDTDVYTGVGQKMYLFGDEALAISSINNLNKKTICEV
ncbi:protein of avirulence locus ImpE [Photobacterium makurazakiensis]|uniref:type VI secretion system accessory protein TagJ n=1 Tax=Photobacterium makurazakiensis TaxID=2910234 RepID=UPI003D0FD609